MSKRSMFMFGLAFGAWLNIWTPAIHPMAGFCFAYLLVFVAMFAHIFDTPDKKEF